MIYDFINFFYKHNNYDTVFIWTSSYSQLVDHRLRDFHALRLWTSARLPALSIPSTAPFLFELLNLLFTPMQLSCLSLSISTHRNCWVYIKENFQLQHCCCDCFNPNVNSAGLGSGGVRWKCCCCGCRGHERLAARLPLLRQGDPNGATYPSRDAPGVGGRFSRSDR